MCGIMGYVGTRQALPILLDGLRRLEYRGYDSAGVAVLENGHVVVRKSAGKLSVLEAIASYLKDELGLRFNEIARAMHRDQRNVWTVYSRAKRKLAAAGKKSGKSGSQGEDENTK